VFPSLARKATRKMLEKLALTPDRPLIFHALSGNGIYFYCQLLRQCAESPEDSATQTKAKKDVLRRIAGCITDSAPPRFDRDTFTRGFVGAILDFLSGKFGKPPSPSNSPSPNATSMNASPPSNGTSSKHPLPRYAG
jgi:Eukaryotic protein of unknown function (DUF829)